MEYVRETIRIGVPPARVWAIVSSFGALELWCPLINAVELEGVGIGSIRIAYLPGIVSREQLLEVDAGARKIIYSLLDSAAVALRNIRSTMQVVADGPDGSEVTWFSEADAAPDLVKIQAGEMVGAFYRNCLESLKQLMERN